jgi:uncharacterized protein YjbJ (UPF0337 family)
LDHKILELIQEGKEMVDDVLAGMWKQIRGQVKETWGKLTDDDLDVIDGNRDQLVGKLQERYGWTKMQADDEYDRFMRESGRM